LISDQTDVICFLPSSDIIGTKRSLAWIEKLSTSVKGALRTGLKDSSRQVAIKNRGDYIHESIKGEVKEIEVRRWRGQEIRLKAERREKLRLEAEKEEEMDFT